MFINSPFPELFKTTLTQKALKWRILEIGLVTRHRLLYVVTGTLVFCHSIAVLSWEIRTFHSNTYHYNNPYSYSCEMWHFFRSYCCIQWGTDTSDVLSAPGESLLMKIYFLHMWFDNFFWDFWVEDLLFTLHADNDINNGEENSPQAVNVDNLIQHINFYDEFWLLTSLCRIIYISGLLHNIVSYTRNL